MKQIHKNFPNSCNKNLIPKGSKYGREVPDTEILKGYSADLITTVFDVVNEYFVYLDKPDWLIIFKERFGFGLDCQKTRLLTIANKFNLSKERVRQILYIIIVQIKQLLEGQQLFNPRIIFKGCNGFLQFQKKIANMPLITLSTVTQILGISKYKEQWLNLLMSICGYNNDVYKNKIFYYKISTAVAITSKITAIKFFLSGQALYVARNDLCDEMQINSNLDFYLEFISDLQVKKEKKVLFYRLPMKCLKSIHCCIYRILYEVGRPMFMSDIHVELVAHGKYKNKNNNDNYYSSKLVKIGHTGKWALREWNINHDSVPKLIEKFLLQINKPVTFAQIIESLNKIRPIKNDLVNSTIRICRRFVQYDDGLWGMKIWRLNKRKKVKHVYYKNAPITDEITKLLVKMLKKERLLLAYVVKEISKQGYLIPTIYSIIDDRPDLFVKTNISQKRKFIALK